MDVKILVDRSEGCEIHIHCQSREGKEVKQLLFLLESTRQTDPRLPSTANFPAQTLPDSLCGSSGGQRISVHGRPGTQLPLFPEFSGKRIGGGRLFPLREKRGSKPAADRTAEKPTGWAAAAHPFQRRKNTGKPALCGGTAPPTGRLHCHAGRGKTGAGAGLPAFGPQPAGVEGRINCRLPYDDIKNNKSRVLLGRGSSPVFIREYPAGKACLPG